MQKKAPFIGAFFYRQKYRKLKNPYLQIIAFGIILYIGTIAILTIISYHLPIISWYALVYFTLMTLGLHYLVAPYISSKNKNFINIFLGTLGIRMLLSLAFLLLYLLFSTNRELPFISYYLLLYLFFAGFEIYLLLSKLRADSEKKV